MLIPRIGGPDVLFCVRPAKDGKEAAYRPAKIVSIGHYDNKGATVNMQVFTDGSNDVEDLGDEAKKGMIWKPSVAYDEKSEKAGTWKYALYVPGPRVEIIEIRDDIQHGREIIKKGAMGTWDQLKNTIRFPDEFIEGKHPDQQPEYAANEFIDWHVARLVMPEGYLVMAVPAPLQDGKERPHERQEYLNDLLEEWANDPMTRFPSSVRRVWGRGAMRQGMVDQIKREQEELANQERERSGNQPLITQDNETEEQSGDRRRRARQLQNAGK